MQGKKRYKKPEIFKVQLDPGQAIVAVCHASASSAQRFEDDMTDFVCRYTCKHDEEKKPEFGCNSAAGS